MNFNLLLLCIDKHPGDNLTVGKLYKGRLINLENSKEALYRVIEDDGIPANRFAYKFKLFEKTKAAKLLYRS